MSADFVLLVETAEGSYVAVPFTTSSAAENWERKYGDVIEGRGCVPIVTKAEARRLSRSAVSA